MWKLTSLVKTQLLKAIHLHCNECLGADVWKGGTDCVDEECDLYPARPGSGPGRAKPHRQRSTGNQLGNLDKNGR